MSKVPAEDVVLGQSRPQQNCRVSSDSSVDKDSRPTARQTRHAPCMSARLSILTLLLSSSCEVTTTSAAFTDNCGAGYHHPLQRINVRRSTIPPLISTITNTDFYRDLVFEPAVKTRKGNQNVKSENGDGEESSMDDNRPNGVDDTLYRMDYDNEDDHNEPTSCRIVTLADAKLPKPTHGALFEQPQLLRRLDDIYHATAHEETRHLKYMAQNNKNVNTTTTAHDQQDSNDMLEQRRLSKVVRSSLEDAGFALLSKRDLDLCEALNAGYLLRLSIVPDVSELDDGIAKEFYPERFDPVTGKPVNPDELLFGGRVLVYRRGYAQEVTRGRLLLPKLDYLQASLVQRSAAWFKLKLDDLEEAAAKRVSIVYRKISLSVLVCTRNLIDSIPNPIITSFLRARCLPKKSDVDLIKERTISQLKKDAAPSKFFKLNRYVGSHARFRDSLNFMDDALAPFEACANPAVDNQDYTESSSIVDAQENTTPLMTDGSKAKEQTSQSLNDHYTADLSLKCPYDVGRSSLGPDLTRPPMQLLERVTIRNLVDIFSRKGRRKLLKTLISRSELVEPTYEEVVVVWRPLASPQGGGCENNNNKKDKTFLTPPKFVYELADMFDVEGLPDPNERDESKKPESTRSKLPELEIRTFEGVPMANLPAVLPKTKLVFRPADAFVFDLVSLVSFLIVVSAQRFDSPQLDGLAVVSVSLWLLRTVLRYSNKLARYDLLVKTFLTSKLSHRNAGALKYLVREAGSQRATRAALVHTWLCLRRKLGQAPTSRAQIIREGSAQVNQYLLPRTNNTFIPIAMDAALNDLEELELVRFNERDGKVQVVHEPSRVIQKLKRTWDRIFDGHMSLEDLIGRRRSENSFE